MAWCLHMSSLWYNLKYNKYSILKVVAKAVYGLLKTIVIILYGIFMYLHTTMARITGHPICKIWLKGYCNVLSSIAWMLSSLAYPILPISLLPGLSSLLAQRMTLRNVVTRYTQFDLNVLLYGDSGIDHDRNVVIIQAVHDYIRDSERF